MSNVFEAPHSEVNVMTNLRRLKRVVEDSAAFYRTFRDLTPELTSAQRQPLLNLIRTWQGPEVEVQILLQVERLDSEER